jgi:DNA-binding winged helix-turn-helix (wHTH) protein
MMSLWNSDEFISDNTLTVNVNRLRHSLKDIGMNDFIQTKKGIGYIIP